MLTAQEVGEKDGLLNVERVLCQIMAARHPGTTWVPASAQDEAVRALTGQTIRRSLTGPADDNTIPDGSPR